MRFRLLAMSDRTSRACSVRLVSVLVRFCVTRTVDAEVRDHVELAVGDQRDAGYVAAATAGWAVTHLRPAL